MAALARLRMAALCLLVLLLVAASCEDPRVVGVTIDSGGITLAVGETHTLTATADTRGGASPTIEWLSVSPGVASVTDAGVVQGVAPGTSEIVARSVFDPSRHDSVVATVVASAAQKTLTVVRAGSGTGTVTSAPAGIDCGETCTASFAGGTIVTLTANAAVGSSFVGWGGACSDSAPTCNVGVTETQSVTATFDLLPVATWTLTVVRGGTGTGTVTSDPAGIDCGDACSASFVDGTSVTLTAAAGAGSSFVGWGGACAGTAVTCAVSMTDAREVTAAFAPSDADAHTLLVSRLGSGSGSVTSDPAGIDCGGACSAEFPHGTSVTLTANAAAGSSFVGWGGACAGTATTCTVNMTEARGVVATFDAQVHTLSVSRAGSGSGTVTSSPAGIDCGAACSAQFAHGTSVTLTAGAPAGSLFAGWSGACAGTASTCTVSMTQAHSVTATFEAQTYVLSVTRSGSGSGTVTSSPAGIDCGGTCSASFAHGTGVTLTAAAGASSEFSGWGGACAGTSTTCSLSMTEPRSVTATFTYLVTPIRPANDDFADRITVAGTSGSTTGTNVQATKELGEPNHAGSAGGASVWWSWTAPASGWVRFDTVGSDFDTVLAVYTGSAVNALTHIASNDDHEGLASRVTFYANSGTAYRIAVDGWGGNAGSITLRWGAPLPPVNDDFANSGYLWGGSGSATGLNVGATLQAGEPVQGSPGGRSVWWTWTAPATGWVAFDTDGSDFDTLLGVYTGSAVNALTYVAWNDDAAGIYPRSYVVFAAVLGVSYRIVVDGYYGAHGNVRLNWGATAAPTAAPFNDRFVDAIVLRGVGGSTSGSNLNATEDEFEPNHAGNMGGRSVWWVWTAHSGGSVAISTAGSDFDTLLAVYTGSAVSALTHVASNDDYGGTLQSRVAFTAVAGTTYRIAVDGLRGGTGAISTGFVKLNWNH
jgi:hypothetical protein